MHPIKVPSGIATDLTYICPNCGNPIVFDYKVENKDIIWTVHRGELIKFFNSACGICSSEYVLPIKINTKVSIGIDGYMTKEEHDSMFR